MVHASIDRAIIATLIAKVIDFSCDFVSVMTGNKVFFSRRRTSPKKSESFHAARISIILRARERERQELGEGRMADHNDARGGRAGCLKSMYVKATFIDWTLNCLGIHFDKLRRRVEPLDHRRLEYLEGAIARSVFSLEKSVNRSCSMRVNWANKYERFHCHLDRDRIRPGRCERRNFSQSHFGEP